MSQPDKKLTETASFDESADNYHLRLLTLEAELKEMLFARRVSQKKFRSRQKQLQFLADKLADIRATWETQTSINAHDPLFPMPVPQNCSSEELRICEVHLADRAGLLRKVARDTASVLTWVKVAVTGRSFPMRTNFYLSGLRAKIAFIDAKLRDAESVRKSRGGFVEELEKEELPALPSKRPAIEVFKAVFDVFGQRNQRILSLRKEVQQEADRMIWMEKWLNFQEMKMTSYLPHTPLPEQARLRVLSKEVLTENTELLRSLLSQADQGSEITVNEDFLREENPAPGSVPSRLKIRGPANRRSSRRVPLAAAER